MDCCILIFMETWLPDNLPDTAIQQQGLTSFRGDRNPATSGQTHGGLCVYINNDWCVNATVVAAHCPPQLESIGEMQVMRC